MASRADARPCSPLPASEAGREEATVTRGEMGSAVEGSIGVAPHFLEMSVHSRLFDPGGIGPGPALSQLLGTILAVSPMVLAAGARITAM